MCLPQSVSVISWFRSTQAVRAGAGQPGRPSSRRRPGLTRHRMNTVGGCMAWHKPTLSSLPCNFGRRHKKILTQNIHDPNKVLEGYGLFTIST